MSFEIDTSLPSSIVIRSLEQIIEWRGKPVNIRMDNRPEFISHIFKNWANKNQINLLYIQPEKPTQNAYIERFNRTFREELLDNYIFKSIEQVQLLATKWQWAYNNERPHSAI